MKLTLLPKREKTLVLEILPQKTRGLLLSIEPDKNIKLEKFWENFSWSHLSRKLRHHIQNWKIVIAADPSLAVTLMFPIKMTREVERIKEPVSAVEIENLLAQATARVFNQCRADASRHLRIDELNTVLIDNRVSNFRVDGHQVINPLDFKARRVDAILELTLTTRDIFEEWKNFFSIGPKQNFFFTEFGKAELFVLSKTEPSPVNLMILTPDKSHYFTLETTVLGPTIDRGRLRWSTNLLLKTISSTWGVSTPIARSIYNHYLNKSLSSNVIRFFDNNLKAAMNPFFVQAQRTRLKGVVYIDTHLPLPLVFPRRQGKVIFRDLPLTSLLDKLGFKINLAKWPWSRAQTLRLLAPFLEFYYNNKDLEINHWLRRRLHWLGTQ